MRRDSQDTLKTDYSAGFCGWLNLNMTVGAFLLEKLGSPITSLLFPPPCTTATTQSGGVGLVK